MFSVYGGRTNVTWTKIPPGYLTPFTYIQSYLVIMILLRLFLCQTQLRLYYGELGLSWGVHKITEVKIRLVLSVECWGGIFRISRIFKYKICHPRINVYKPQDDVSSMNSVSGAIYKYLGVYSAENSKFKYP